MLATQVLGGRKVIQCTVTAIQAGEEQGKMTNSEANPERVQEDARLMYGLYGSAINFLKSQQWTATYYVLVIYGTMLGYAALFGHFDSATSGATAPIAHLRCWEVAALIVIAAVSGLVGICYLRV